MNRTMSQLRRRIESHVTGFLILLTIAICRDDETAVLRRWELLKYSESDRGSESVFRCICALSRKPASEEATTIAERLGMWLLNLFSALCAVLLTRVLWRRWKYDLHKIPSPPALPLLGHVLAIMKEGELGKYNGRAWKKLGCPKVMKFKLVEKDILMITDSEYFKSVIASKTNPFPRTFMTKNGIAPILGNKSSAKCLVHSLELTPCVKAIRRVYSTGFQSNILKASVPKVQNVLDKMVEIVERQRCTGAVDFQTLCAKMTLDIIGVVAFDTNLGGLDGSRELYQCILDVGYYVVSQFHNPFRILYNTVFPASKTAREDRRIQDQLTAEWDKLTKEIIGREDARGEEEPIWVGLKRLIDPETGKALLHDSFLAEVAAIVIAGMDTTGHQLAWILALLASNPDKTDQLVEELNSHGLCGKDARNAVFDDLAELPYLTAVIKEGMRIAHVSIGAFFRMVPRDITILGYHVPAGTKIMFPSTRYMCTEAYWGDPDVFRPERWLTDEDMSQKFYLGFSYGARDCVGQRLAMMEMRVALIHLVSKYKFAPTVPFDDLMNNVCDGMAIEAKNGIWLNVSPRHHVV